MQPNKTFIYLCYLCLLPLLFCLILAVVSVYQWPILTGKTLAFARINSNIFAHSYGVILLSFYAGLQLGMLMEKPKTQFYLLFYFPAVLIAWLSFISFADFKGMTLLLFCQIAVAMVDYSAGKNNLIKPCYANLKITINTILITLLSALILINR